MSKVLNEIYFDIEKSRMKAFESALNVFTFLNDFGYSVATKNLDSGVSAKSGFKIIFRSNQVKFHIEYGDMELELTFSKNDIRIHYLVLDKLFFNNSSKLKGNMFTVDKLILALTRIAEDIKNNYRAILIGDLGIWNRISLIVEKQAQIDYEKSYKFTLETSNPEAREKAKEALKNKDYKNVVDLLEPLLPILERNYVAKYNFAKKKLK